MSSAIIAAGAVIWRKNAEKKIEIAVVHRPRYNDWTIPKGKLEVGETLISCAYREAQEETGLAFHFGPFLGSVQYATVDGQKIASYWAAKHIPQSHDFTPNSEVDRLEWWDTDKALKELTRDTDKEVLNLFLDSPYDATPLVLLRHAKALVREEWQGEDEDRPLEIIGQNQARRMMVNLAPYQIAEVHTSDAVRCYDTVIGFARALSIDPVITSDVSEYTFKKNKEKSLDFIKKLAEQVSQTESATVVCSHNPVLPKMLGKLLKKSKIADKELPAGKLLPGDAWVLFLKKKKVVQVDYLPAP